MSRPAPRYELALETSGLTGSAAIGEAGTIRGEMSFGDTRSRAADMLPVIDELFRELGARPCDIGAVYVSAGPGSFTGLRIGVTLARILATVTGAQLVAVPTLTAIAMNLTDITPSARRAVVMLNAKRGNVYAADFEFGTDGPRTLRIACEISPEEILRQQEAFDGEPAEVVLIGEGVEAYRAVIDRFPYRVAPSALHTPRAGAVYALGTRMAANGEFTPLRDLVPAYVRPPEALERWLARQGQAESAVDRGPAVERGPDDKTSKP